MNIVRLLQSLYVHCQGFLPCNKETLRDLRTNKQSQVSFVFGLPPWPGLQCYQWDFREYSTSYSSKFECVQCTTRWPSNG